MNRVRAFPTTSALNSGADFAWNFAKAFGSPLEANSGGPRSRTRSEQVRSTVLGNTRSPIHCPRRLTLGIDFEDAEPFEHMSRLLRSSGFTDAEELRVRFPAIPGPMLCHVDSNVQPINAHSADSDEVLHQAFLLGLCTSVFFDPSRPVIWTRASLTRRLALFDTAGFYA